MHRCRHMCICDTHTCICSHELMSTNITSIEMEPTGHEYGHEYGGQILSKCELWSRMQGRGSGLGTVLEAFTLSQS